PDDRVTVIVPPEGRVVSLAVGPARVGGGLAVVDDVLLAVDLDEAAVAAAGEDRSGQLQPRLLVGDVPPEPLEDAHPVGRGPAGVGRVDDEQLVVLRVAQDLGPFVDRGDAHLPVPIGWSAWGALERLLRFWPSLAA